MKNAWTIAGSDSSGAAGVQADIKTFTAFGLHGCSLVTSVTAQSSYGLEGIEPVSLPLLKTQWEALSQDLLPSVIKMGLISDSSQMDFIFGKLGTFSGPLVCDPVFQTSSRHNLQTENFFEAYLQNLKDHNSIVTPNLMECERITGLKILSPDEMEASANRLISLGISSFYLKGGHLSSNEALDFCSTPNQTFYLKTKKHNLTKTRGTGCTLSSAIASALALGYPLEDSFVLAKIFISRAIRRSSPTPNGVSLLSYGLDFSPEDMPQLVSDEALNSGHPREDRMGFYPIVDRASEVEKLYRWGVPVVQLRVKDLVGYKLEKEIQIAISHSKNYQKKIYINDHWELAIRYGAYGIHLGQEDLDTADIKKLSDSKVHLGISTHSLFELARALSYRPSYIALGPIYPTTLKAMKFGPQGLLNLKLWKSLTDLPLVAIGGMTLENGPGAIAAGADGISVVSDLTKFESVEERVKGWLHLTGPTFKG